MVKYRRLLKVVPACDCRNVIVHRLYMPCANRIYLMYVGKRNFL